MKTRIIRDGADLSEFRQRYVDLTGAPVDMAYLERSMVRGFYAETGELRGGYVFCDRPPFRYLSAVPVPVLGEERLALFCECTCIWIDASVGQLDRIQLYIQNYRDACATGKRYFLGGSVEEKIMRLQRLALPELLYSGPVRPEVGAWHIWLYAGTRFTVIRAMLLNFPHRLWRVGRRRMRGALLLKG